MAQTLLKKMHVKLGMRLLVLHAPQGFDREINSQVEEVSVETSPDGQYPAVLLFVSSLQDVELYAPQALEAIAFDGLLWMAYPKGSSGVKTDINRDHGWDVVRSQGYETVSAISIDGTWSALRFRPIKRVGK